MFTVEFLSDLCANSRLPFKKQDNFKKRLSLKAFQPGMRVDCRVFMQDLINQKFLGAEDQYVILDCQRQKF